MKMRSGINDQTTPANGDLVFVCSNYWKAMPYGSSGMIASPLCGRDRSNGPLGLLERLYGDNVESVILNTYNVSDANGFYLGRMGFLQPESEGTLGMFLASSGSTLKSYYPDGLALKTSDDTVALRIKEGKVAIGDGAPIARYLSATLTWDPPSLGNGASTTIRVSVPGALVGDPVTVGHNKITAGKISIDGNVTTAGVVTVTLFNQTGSTLNLAGGILRVGVWQHTLADASEMISGDANGDGVVDVGDLGILAANYGASVDGMVHYDADYAAVFGTVLSGTDDPVDDQAGNVMCNVWGVPLIANLALMGLGSIRQS